jgi:trimethylamine--corrinoid protein Co-methyltransferase
MRRDGTAPVAGAIRQRPWKVVERRFGSIEVISADEVESIHQAALRIIEEIGIRVLDDEARRRYREAGATVDELQVRMDRHMVETLLATVPSTFVLRSRNPARDLPVGGASTFFCSTGGPAFVMDNERGRRSGTFAEFCDYLKVVQSLDIVHQEGGGPFEALDLPAQDRHLDYYLAQITLLDKNWQPQTLGRLRVLDALDMTAVAFGVDREGMRDITALSGVINTNSPLQLDIPMAQGLMTLAEYNQVAVVTPFTLAGAMGPITLAGSLALQHAEAMVGIVLTQLVRPGAPAMYGAFTSNVDMRTGSPAFGTPEYTLAAQASGQLARRLGIPYRSSNATAANDVDAQAAYESQMSLWGALTGGAHMILHGAGWLGGGLVGSFEKLILDAEMMQMMAAYFEGFSVTDADLAFDAIREVGPGGHFFGAAHTLERYTTAFYTPLLSNWDNYETWVERGRVDARQRAGQIWRSLLDAYEPPPIDDAVVAELHEIVARRKAEGGAPMN